VKGEERGSQRCIPAAMFVAVTTMAMAEAMQKARGMPGLSISPSTAGVGSTLKSTGRSSDLRISDPVIAAAPMHCSTNWITVSPTGSDAACQALSCESAPPQSNPRMWGWLRSVDGDIDGSWNLGAVLSALAGRNVDIMVVPRGGGEGSAEHGCPCQSYEFPEIGFPDGIW